MTEQEFRNFFALGLCVQGLCGVKREPVAYLYNGVRLPDIHTVYTPEIQKTNPFAVIVETTKGVYRLICLEQDNALVSSSGVFVASGQHNFVSYDLANGVWVQEDNGSYYLPAVWTNHNLYYSGDLYLAASDPIPIYE